MMLSARFITRFLNSRDRRSRCKKQSGDDCDGSCEDDEAERDIAVIVMGLQKEHKITIALSESQTETGAKL